MKKAIKLILGLIVASILLVVVLILTLPLWLGPVVKPTANTLVPQFTKTAFHLGVLSLNPYTGRFELGDMQLANPVGYSAKQAVTVNKVVVDVAMDSVPTDVIHVEEVTVDGVYVSYLKGGANNVDNFTQIQYNVAGGKEKYEAKQAKAKAEAKPKETPVEEKEAAPSKKVVIDLLVINDIKVDLGYITLPVPSITLKDIGKKSSGASLVEVGDAIWQSILKSAMAVGDGAKLLGAALGDGAALLGDGAGKAASATASGVKAVGAGAGKAASAATDAATSGVKAVGEGAGKAVDAVGDGAKKAADALKSLF